MTPSPPDFQNPFRQFRAEQFSENLWEYYVPEPFSGLLGAKPLVLEGGRGSGKTMFFLFNSWREQRFVRNQADRGMSLEPLLSKDAFVGLYHKVDGPFVSALHGGDIGEERWNGVFATYFGCFVAIDLFDLLQAAILQKLTTEKELSPFLRRVGELLESKAPIASLAEARRRAINTLDMIENLAYDHERMGEANPTIPGRLVAEILSTLREVSVFADMNIHVFVDEYESLLDYQQRHINSLVKRSKAGLTYDIGVRPGGMRTTLALSQGEKIEAPHDFRRFRPEYELLPEGGAEPRKLMDVLKKISRKRLEKAQVVPSNAPSHLSDIEWYLGHSDVESELQALSTKPIPPEASRELESLIAAEIKEPEKLEEYLQKLVRNAGTAHARLHLCLLRRKHHRPTVEELAREFDSWRSDGAAGSPRYRDWWHNTRTGLAFLLAHELRVRKQYSGMDVYSLLSSGIIRYFIELCEMAFDTAHEEGFSWANPQPLRPDQQTRAARNVSRYKIGEIVKYEPRGPELNYLTMSLGRLFEAFHEDARTTLGQPERNHFSISAMDLTADNSGVKGLLDWAVFWTVLQERRTTKERDVASRADAVEYSINRIYAPFFQISYRLQRKITLTVEDVKALSGPSSSSEDGRSAGEKAKSALRDLIERLSPETVEESRESNAAGQSAEIPSDPQLRMF